MLAVLPPEKAVAFLAVQLAVFGLYMGSSFAPNHIGMPLVSPKLKLDFLRRQVLMSRNITGGPLISIFMGGLNYQIEHHLFPSMARPHLRKIQSLVADLLCRRRGPLHPDQPVAVLPNRHRLPQHGRTERQGPVPLPPRRPTPRHLNHSPACRRRQVDQLLTRAVAAIAGAMNALSELWKYSIVRRSPSRS